MDQQKYASCAQVLAKALVEKAKEMDNPYDPEIGHILPSFPLHEARQIMTRADFIEQVSLPPRGIRPIPHCTAPLSGNHRRTSASASRPR